MNNLLDAILCGESGNNCYENTELLNVKVGLLPSGQLINASINENGFLYIHLPDSSTSILNSNGLEESGFISLQANAIADLKGIASPHGEFLFYTKQLSTGGDSWGDYFGVSYAGGSCDSSVYVTKNMCETLYGSGFKLPRINQTNSDTNSFPGQNGCINQFPSGENGDIINGVPIPTLTVTNYSGDTTDWFSSTGNGSYQKRAKWYTATFTCIK